MSVRISGRCQRQHPSATEGQETQDGVASHGRQQPRVGKQGREVRRTAPPPRPRSGQYRDKSGAVNFRISNGKVVGFSVRTQLTCGGSGTTPQYSQVVYDFPKTKIARNGIVDASESKSQYGSSLSLRAVGSKVIHGGFGYSDNAGCYAVEKFTAKRVGG